MDKNTPNKINVLINFNRNRTISNQYTPNDSDPSISVTPVDELRVDITKTYRIYNSVFCADWYVLEPQGERDLIYLSPNTARELYSYMKILAEGV